VIQELEKLKQLYEILSTMDRGERYRAMEWVTGWFDYQDKKEAEKRYAEQHQVAMQEIKGYKEAQPKAMFCSQKDYGRPIDNK